MTQVVALYDDDCGFCTRSLAVVQRMGFAKVVFRPLHGEDLTPLGITLEEAMASMAAFGPDGRVLFGADAWALILRTTWWSWPLGALMVVPGFSWLSRRLYRLVADNRYRLPGGSPTCKNPNVSD